MILSIRNGLDHIQLVMSTEKAIDFKQTVIYYIFNNNLSPT